MHGLAKVEPVQSVGIFGPDSSSSRERTAAVFAHEIGHNFGLAHDLSATPSLLDVTASSNLLKDFQIDQILNSRFSQPISGGSDNAAAVAGGSDTLADTGGCDCGICGFCTGANPA